MHSQYLCIYSMCIRISAEKELLFYKTNQFNEKLKLSLIDSVHTVEARLFRLSVRPNEIKCGVVIFLQENGKHKKRGCYANEFHLWIIHSYDTNFVGTRNGRLPNISVCKIGLLWFRLVWSGGLVESRKNYMRSTSWRPHDNCQRFHYII